MAVWTVLDMFFINLSACPLALGSAGVMFRTVNPHSAAYSLNSCDRNGGPLSVVISVGYPNSENIFSNLGMTVLAESPLQ